LSVANRQLPQELIKHNDGVLNASDAGRFLNWQSSPPLYIEPTVTYNSAGKKTEIIPNQEESLWDTIKGFFADDKPIEYQRDNFHVVGRRDVPMGDWDWDSPSHSGDSVTISNLNNAYELIKDVAGKYNQTWDIYLTPGGVRADLMSHRMTPEQFTAAGLFDEMRIDPMYAKISTQPRRYQNVVDNYVDLPVFNTRVSQKPRPGDFVSYKLGTIGDAPINPYNKRIIDKYHVGGVQRALLNSPTNPYEDAANLLAEQSNGLPSSFLSPVQQELDYFIANYKPRV
jgi:hypothetical protein